MIDEVVNVARVMRAGGARVGTGEVEAAALALGAVPASRTDAYLALRAVLCSRRADLPLFDTAFAAVFGAPTTFRPPTPPTAPDLAGAGAALPRVAGGDEGSGLAPDPDPAMRPAAYSDAELLLDKDFAEYTERERALARIAIARLARRGPTRRSRRTTAAPRRGARPDLQRTLRASLRTGGDPLHRRWREPATRPRRLVLVCDVSGSMAPYARVLLQYLHAAVAAHRRVEAFAFGTRLTRLTRELDERDPDRALGRAAEAVVDWSGGTRIGASLSTLNREYGRRIGRGAVVVILSDGWDRGDPDELAREMGRLRRSAHRVIWLNPLKAAPGYEPLARGMAAALPETDHFLAGNSLASLAALAEILQDTT
ncbi:MAG: VWA domain-containing protein [Solirubrobacteraceae bacterium]